VQGEALNRPRAVIPSQGTLNSTETLPRSYAILHVPLKKLPDKMPGQETTPPERKQTDSDNMEQAKRALVNNDGSVTTRGTEGKRLQTQEQNKSKPQRASPQELPIEVWWKVIDGLENDQNALVACTKHALWFAEDGQRGVGVFLGNR